MDNEPGAPQPISLHLLKQITKGFSEQQKLGGGTYGDVYLGEHENGDKIAVKVLKDFDLDDKLFEKEYSNLASLDHKNIVRLVGYCHETMKQFIRHEGRIIMVDRIKRALCFEYIHNGSLDKFISDESNGHNWYARYTIIKGICEGLEYLHKKLNHPMLHLDLKPANVLLDDNMTPKIADFGLSRLFGGDKTQETKSAIGTPGYVPPEYIDSGMLSTKFDIFSLGVVIIKIMTGRNGYFRSAEMSPKQFVELVHTDWMNRLHAEAMLLYSTQVRRCIEIALRCVDADRRKRPDIGEIVNNLNEMEFPFQILDALRNVSNKVCPCIFNETDMLDILKNKLISYPLRITDNGGGVHEATVTTVGDPAADTSTSVPVIPRIKIIDCTDGLGKVTTIDVHSTEPWILVGHIYANVSIWNHQKQTRVMAFHKIDGRGDDEVCTVAKFIEPMQCFVVGDIRGDIHVYSYVKAHKLDQFRAHEDWVNSLAVHPSEPLVLSASCDKLIKLWNWEADWQCIQTFEGHSDFVHQVRFNPETAGNSFASSSRDFTVKIWVIHSPTPIATLHCNSNDQTHLDYFTPSGERRYLVTGSVSGNAQIWDLQTNTIIKQIKGLQKWGCNVAVVEGLPDRPILLTVSSNRTVTFCDSTTHMYENMVNFNLGTVRTFAYINMIKSLAIGCEEGIAIMEIN